MLGLGLRLDLNGYTGRHIDGFDVVHEGYGESQINMEGRMLLEFCLKNCVKCVV